MPVKLMITEILDRWSYTAVRVHLWAFQTVSSLKHISILSSSAVRYSTHVIFIYIMSSSAMLTIWSVSHCELCDSVIAFISWGRKHWSSFRLRLKTSNKSCCCSFFSAGNLSDKICLPMLSFYLMWLGSFQSNRNNSRLSDATSP